MRKRGHRNPAPLFALAGMTLLTSAALAQQPQSGWSIGSPGSAGSTGSAGSAGSTDAPLPYSPSATAAAQGDPAQSGGITLKLMGEIVTVHPSVRLELRHDDNVYLAPSGRIADQILVLIPAVRLEARKAANSFSLRLSTTLGQYQKNTADNYTNYNVSGLANLILSTRLRARISGDYLNATDPRGSTNDANSAVPSAYDQLQGRGIVSYGAQGAKGRIDVELGYLRRRYHNNREITAGNDRDVGDIGATFYWRVGPRTSLLLQGKHSKIDYTLPASTLGSIENALLAGAVWDATAKTTGTFKIGMVKKDFEDAGRDSSRAISWTGEVRWSPLTYSHVDVNLTRAPAETTGGVGNFIDRTSTGTRWTHDWSSRLTTQASASYLTDAYQGVARTDNTQNYGMNATYKMRRWLSFGGDYAHSTRSSDNSGFAYQRNVFMLFVNAAL